jgi:hypothetical protein
MLPRHCNLKQEIQDAHSSWIAIFEDYPHGLKEN